jgi:hypothetical protein
MKRGLSSAMRRMGLGTLLGLMICTMLVGHGRAQGGGYERTFKESKATIEKVLKDMQPAMSGRLPVLDGFALAGDHPLDRYQRGYFQAAVEVSAAPSGGSVVRVRAKVTAWFSDTIPSRSGYQLLTSNGRLEGDLLDQLSSELSARAVATETPRPAPPPETVASVTPPPAKPTESVKTPQPDESAPSAPMPRLPETGGTFSSKVAEGLAAKESGATQTPPNSVADRDPGGLKAEAESLEEILKNQTRPKNLVAVKKSGTPVVATASLTAKTLFMASAHDEFEMLDFNTDWVHVRISGLSRGWIWRNSLEMPEGVPDVATGSAPAPAADDFFKAIREETAPFPGDWAPLRNKSVKIISVQQIDEAAKGTDPKVKLEFAKSLLDKSYQELSGKTELAGVVLIFDSADGGMIATTIGTLQQWKAGKLSDAALWHQSYFDPPETFDSAGPSASQ